MGFMRLWVLWDFTESIYLESRWSENIFTIGWQFWIERGGLLRFNELFHSENSMNAWPWYGDCFEFNSLIAT